MSNLMIDIETLGTGTDAAILSIGYCEFTLAGPKGLGSAGAIPVTGQSCIDAGLTVDFSTITWWTQQSKEARDAVFVSARGDSITMGLSQLAQLFNKDTIVWAKPALFDLAILTTAYRKVLNSDPPWHRRNVRCLYTLADIAMSLNIMPPLDITNKVAHSAASDAFFQARLAAYYMLEIKRKCE